jgi:hypothetical protein
LVGCDQSGWGFFELDRVGMRRNSPKQELLSNGKRDINFETGNAAVAIGFICL